MGKIGERSNFKKKLKMQHENITSSEPSVNVEIEAVMAGENDPSTQDPVLSVADEDDLIELFDQFSGLMRCMLD